MKTCRKCGAPFSSKECKPCQAARCKAWFLAHPNYSRERYAKHPERERTRSAEWAKSHRQNVNATKKKSYAKNPAAHRERSRKYASAHREEAAARARKWYSENSERAKLSMELWMKSHPGYGSLANRRRSDQIRTTGGSITKEEWDAIVSRQGGKCAHCRLRRDLTLDHINPVSKGGCGYAFNVQGLCRSCNSKKYNKVRAGDPVSLFDRLAS